MYRSILAILVSALWAYAQECERSDMENDKPCYQRFTEYPKYSNGESYKENTGVCFGEFFHVLRPYRDTTVNGIPVSVNTWFRPCKKVNQIDYRPNYPSYDKYIVYYDSETTYSYIVGSKSYYGIRKTADMFYEDNVVELFRKDGSLRYRGKVNFEGESVSTSGDCYDKMGATPTRHTNNANTCK